MRLRSHVSPEHNISPKPCNLKTPKKLSPYQKNPFPLERQLITQITKPKKAKRGEKVHCPVGCMSEETISPPEISDNLSPCQMNQVELKSLIIQSKPKPVKKKRMKKVPCDDFQSPFKIDLSPPSRNSGLKSKIPKPLSPLQKYRLDLKRQLITEIPKSKKGKSADIFRRPDIVNPLKEDLRSLKRLTEIISECPLKKPKQSFKTPINRKSVFKPQSRLSTLAGWTRLFSKYSPSKETTLSPVKASEINLQRSILTEEDLLIDIYTWVVNMSEQFYYDNSILLMNSVKSNEGLIVKSIRRNYKEVDLSFFYELQDVSLLGEGSFGSVFSATDASTSRRYAIKYIAPMEGDMIYHCTTILNYMAERNSVIQAMNSPFVTKFYYSVQLNSLGGVFLFFEFCIGDLMIYIKNIMYDDFADISRRINGHDDEIIQELDRDIKILDVSLMYIFELFCGLDFLAKANMIHQDIKPENLMISETLHLKIGDFGLIYRTRTIHRQTNSLLVTHDEINNVESTNYEFGVEGTRYYMDVETLMMHLESEGNPFLNEVLENKTIFNTPNFRYDDEILTPTSMVDVWAAGLVTIQLLFRGFHIFDYDMFGFSVLQGLPRTSYDEFVIHVVGRKLIYYDFIYLGLIDSGGKCHKELMEFIASIFRPREVRASRYTKEKTFNKFMKQMKNKFLDMDKIENISSFKERNFNSKNIMTFNVPERIREFFEENRSPTFGTFRELLDDIALMDDGQRLVDLRPGLSINYFH